MKLKLILLIISLSLIVFFIQCSDMTHEKKLILMKQFRAANVSETVVSDISKKLKYYSLIDLAFGVPELLDALDRYPHLNNILLTRFKEESKPEANKSENKLDNFIYCKDLQLFEVALTTYKAINTARNSQINQLIRLLNLNGYTFNDQATLSNSQYIEEMKKYDKRDDLFELTSMYFDFLIVDGNNFVKAVKKDDVALNRYRRLLNDIRKKGIFPFWTPPELLKRKIAYFLEINKSTKDILMLETLKSISEAPIILID